MDLSAQLLWQSALNGLALGGVYILIALGLTLIFGITRIMQFAHGEVYMLGAYFAFFLTTTLGLSLLAAICISVLAMAAFGLVLERVVFRPIKGQVLSPIVASLGLIFILQSGALAGFGIYEKTLPALADGSFQVLGSAIPRNRIVAVAIAVALIALLYVFLKRTKFGQAMVASAQNPRGAVLQGINPDHMSALSMAIACGLAAAGGALAGSIFSLTPFMGTLPLVKGLIIIVLGGMGSLLGVVVGGLIVGLVDGIVPVVAGPAVAAILPLVIVILILLAKPQGLFGHE